MASHYEPPSPDTEAANMLSAYHERLRSAELRDLNEVNLTTDASAVSSFNIERLRNALIGIFTKGGRRRL